MAWSSVTRAGGFCGGVACAPACPAARSGANNPKTPSMTSGLSVPALDFMCIVSLLRGTVEALDSAFRLA